MTAPQFLATLGLLLKVAAGPAVFVLVAWAGAWLWPRVFAGVTRWPDIEGPEAVELEAGEMDRP